MNPRNPWTSTAPNRSQNGASSNGANGNQRHRTTQFVNMADDGAQEVAAEIATGAQDHCPCCSTALDVTGIAPLSVVTCPTCAQDFRVLQEIGGYSLSEQLGHGTLGDVYLASGGGLQRQVALKILRSEVLQAPEFVARLTEDVRITMVNHPHVARVYSAGLQNGLYVLAMEHVNGGTLAEWISKRGRIPEAEVVTIATHVAEGLHAAFSHGLIHRNVKPSNILMTDQGVAKVADFGLSFDAAEAAQLPGDMRTIPYYEAPEKTSGSSEDVRSDIYALGAALFHALTGRQPFPGQTAELVAQKHLEHRAPSVQAFAPEVSGATAFVIARMLEKNPAKRHQSYKELLEHLRYAQSESGGARKTGAIPLPPLPTLNQGGSAAAPHSAEEEGSASNNKRTLLIGAIAAGVIIVGTGVWLALPKKPNSGPTGAPMADVSAPGVTPAALSSESPASTAEPAPAAAPAPAPAAISADSPLAEKSFGDALAAVVAGKNDDATTAVNELLNRNDLGKSLRCWTIVLQGVIGLANEKPADAEKAFQSLAAAAQGLPAADSFKGLGEFGGAPGAVADGAIALGKTNFKNIGGLVLGLKAWNAGQVDEASQLFSQFQSADAIPPEENWASLLKSLAADRLKKYNDTLGIEEKAKKTRLGPEFDSIERDLGNVTGPLAKRAAEARNQIVTARAESFAEISNTNEVDAYRIVNRATGKCLGEPDAVASADELIEQAPFRTGNLGQLWRVSHAGYGSIQLVNARDQKLFGPHAKNEAPTPAAVKEYKEATPELCLRFKKVDGRYFVLSSEVGSKVLGAKSTAKTENGVVFDNDRSAPEQQWEIVSVPDAAKWAKQTDRYEIEWLHVAQQSPDAIYRMIFNSKFSGGVGGILDGLAPGAFVTCVIPQVKPGKYEVRIGMRHMATRGIFQLSVASPNGAFTDVGDQQDMFDKKENYEEANCGVWVNAKAEDKWFKFTVVGKNHDATGYLFGPDYIKLIPQ